MDRRDLLKATALAGALSTARHSKATQREQEEAQLDADLETQFSRPVFIATWPFGLAACRRSLEVLDKTQSMRDAVERGIHVTELDESNSSVGVGGLPNASGVVQLDASFMDGKHQTAGAVAALEGFPNPISVARRVMEQTPHALLVGKDAGDFAAKQGFKSRDLLTDDARQAWQNWKKSQPAGNVPQDSHDTIALMGVDEDGHVVGGCSTSGLAYKLPGRVGDSPILGSGLYVDGKVGAAGATGIGENVMRYCGSFLIVEFMRQGRTPTEACVEAIRRIASGEDKPPQDLHINFVALNREGQVGAAGTDAEFRAAIVDTAHRTVAKPVLVR